MDARDASGVSLERPLKRGISLPDNFLEAYFSYIEKENPILAQEIGTKENLNQIMFDQRTQIQGRDRTFDAGKLFFHPRFSSGEKAQALLPNGRGIGQLLFSDALSAIKLHLIAKLMADGKIERGPILDFPGATHTFFKTFCVRYPEYAMEVVLRTLPELMAFRATGSSDLSKELESPDWPEVVRQIARLAFARTGEQSDDIETFYFDYLGEYGIDPEKVIPSDDEIEETMRKIRAGKKSRKK